MTKSELIDWKSHPLTKEVSATIKSRIIQLEQELGESAGVDPLHDRYRAGAIAAYKDFIFLDIYSEEISNA